MDGQPREIEADPNYQFQSATLRIAVAGDTVTMESVVVNASGQKQQMAETFRTDGTETRGTLNPGVKLVARWSVPTFWQASQGRTAARSVW